ncbi:MAG TPA: nitroreductase family protein [Pseudomonadales bacterium]|nr:nitroreductase family protein [Pseudomonadales bacterium]
MTDKFDFTQRDPMPGVAALLSERWSPRAFDGAPIPNDVLTRIIDAVRWAPSCRNEQPWRVYTSNPSNFEQVLHCLDEGNQGWAKSASVIGFIAAHKSFAYNGSDNPYRDFDCGAAWLAMTLQARIEGLYTHGMGGIYKDRAADFFSIDDQFEVVMGFVIGSVKPLAQMTLDERQRHIPSPRKHLDDIWVAR